MPKKRLSVDNEAHRKSAAEHRQSAIKMQESSDAMRKRNKNRQEDFSQAAARIVRQATER